MSPAVKVVVPDNVVLGPPRFSKRKGKKETIQITNIDLVDEVRDEGHEVKNKNPPEQERRCSTKAINKNKTGQRNHLNHQNTKVVTKTGDAHKKKGARKNAIEVKTSKESNTQRINDVEKTPHRKKRNAAKVVDTIGHQKIEGRSIYIAKEREIEVVNVTHKNGNQPSSKNAPNFQTRLLWATNNSETTNARVRYNKYGINPITILTVEDACKVPSPRANSTDVVISVEASTVSESDCFRRCGRYEPSSSRPKHSITSGVDCIGRVVKCSPAAAEKYGIKIFDRVAALFPPEISRKGGNSRFVVLPAASLMNVPESFNAAEAVCVVHSYVAAFQCIQLGLEDEVSLDRYKPTAVRGLVVLVIDGWTGIGRAIVELLVLFGAESTTVYATGPPEQHAFIATLGACPLHSSKRDWPNEVCGNVDLTFDGTCNDGFISSYESLNDAGVLVCFGMNSIERQIMRSSYLIYFDTFMISRKVQQLPQAKMYGGIWESFEERPDEFKNDLQFLFSLLSRDEIWPRIACQVSLGDVPRAQKKIQKERGELSGLIVCDPWK